MANITTYATLVSAIQEEAEDDGTEFLAFIPTAIANAEDRLFRELELPDLVEPVTGTVVSGSNILTKPSGYKFADYLAITVDSKKRILKKRLRSFLVDYWPNEGETGVPKYYAERNSTSFILAPTPNSSYAYVMALTKKPTKLSPSNTTNYYVLNCPETLFYACMVEMATFMKTWPDLAARENKYIQARDSWNIEQMRKRRDGTEEPQNASSGPNSLRHTIDNTQS